MASTGSCARAATGNIPTATQTAAIPNNFVKNVLRIATGSDQYISRGANISSANNSKIAARDCRNLILSGYQFGPEGVHSARTAGRTLEAVQASCQGTR